MTPAQFISTYENSVIEACAGTKLFPSVKMAQLGLETGWGKSVKGNNLTGIKAYGNWLGKVISFSTREEVNGIDQYFKGTNEVYTSITAVPAGVDYQTLFRYYETAADSIRDHSKFLLTNTRYTKAGVFNATTPEAQAIALENAHYATDSDYSEKLIRIIKTNNLKRLDVKKK